MSPCAQMFRPFRSVVLVLGVCLATALIADGPVPAAAQSGRSSRRLEHNLPLFLKQHAELHRKFAAGLEGLATTCDEKNLSAAAAQIRALIVPRDTAEIRLSPLPRAMQPALRDDLPPDERFWRSQLRYHQQEFAKELYLLARRALSAGHVSLAYDAVREVVVQDPDHAPARKVLGFVRNGTEWVSQFEAVMLRDKKVWHDQYGWIPRDHVGRYERGERFFERRWISAAKEAEIRRDFSKAWEVRTEHYLVKTNHSLEKGVELARKLEDFHDLFAQTLPGFFNTAEQALQLFSGKALKSGSMARKNVVHYYRTRDEYIDVLKQETDQPVEITRGIYFPSSGIAYFFYDPEVSDDSTVYHEATHQLLSGSRPQVGQIAVRSNFWLVEGIACYMESFHREGNLFRLGDPSHTRLQAAQHHWRHDKYYVPLTEFASLGMVAFQSAREIRKNYSQCAALTHFFMHYEDGRYREALIEHLSQIYSPKHAVRESPDSLADLTGVESEQIDQEYLQYIDALPTANGPAAASFPNLRE